ncbi:MAG: nuclear transport factor 2 family protein [Rhodospirillales bacterium]|nr:nuclear transport factor 2 family protein [Rhodospirillales bacterium]
MSQRPAVLFANDAFYTAFATGDLAAMDAVWAKRAPVCCIHPGWTALNGRDAIMESWRGILSAGPGDRRRTAAIRCVRPEAFLLGDAAWVACYEILPNGVLVATNIFVPEDGAWRMVHHHAGPAPAVEAGDEADPPRVQ